MSLHLLQFSLADNWITELDVRTKILFAFNMVIISMLIENIIILLGYLLIVFLIISVNYGILHLPRSIWHMRYFVILVLLINFILLKTFQIDILVVILRVFILLFSFYIFNKSTNPDLIVDALIKMKIPSNLAWIIGSTIRQSIFLIEDVSDVMAVQRIRSNFENKSKSVSRFKLIDKMRDTTKQIHPLIVTTFARSILNAKDLGDTMFIRGFEGAHKDIALFTNSFGRMDIKFIVLSIILPNLMSFIIIKMKILY